MGGGFGGEDGAAGPKGGLIAKVKRMFSSWGKKSSSAVAPSAMADGEGAEDEEGEGEEEEDPDGPAVSYKTLPRVRTPASDAGERVETLTRASCKRVVESWRVRTRAGPGVPCHPRADHPGAEAPARSGV